MSFFNRFGRDAAEHVSESAAKDAAEKAARDSAEHLSVDSAQKAAQDAARKSAQDAAEKSAEDVAKTGVRQDAKVASEAKANWLAKNPKLVVGGLSAATIATIALGKFTEANGKQLTITKIDQGLNHTNVTFTPEQRIFQSDTVEIHNSNSTPPIDGTHTVSSRVSNTQITIPVTSPITSAGSSGSMTLHTTFEAQVGGVLGDAAAGVVDVATSAGESLFDTARMRQIFMIICGILSVIVCLYIAFQFMSKK